MCMGLMLALGLVAATFALAREIRLRKALEKLLQLLLTRWRSHVSQTRPPDLDPTTRADDRL